jgi:restriction system protein
MKETKGIIEQIDGVIELDGEIYLAEMKWLKHKAGIADVSQHLVRVLTRDSIRGIFISATDPTDSALQTCKESLTKAVVFICTVQEIVMLVENQGDLKNFLRKELQAAIIDKNPYLKIMST